MSRIHGATEAPPPETITNSAQEIPGIFERIRRGRVSAPRRTLLYGVQGIGKSTWAASAPEPIFLPTEEGLNDVDTSSFPVLRTWQDVTGAVEALYTKQHSFKTVVIDTLDWLEQIIWRELCAVEKKQNIEAFGYGKGYTMVLPYWRYLLEGLDALRSDRGMHVILLAHSEIKRFESPTTPAYDRFGPRIHKAAAAVLQEWCDEVLFANWRVFVSAVDADKDKGRGIGTGERVVHTTEQPYCAAKNRLGLPETLPLTWEDYAKHFNR